MYQAVATLGFTIATISLAKQCYKLNTKAITIQKKFREYHARKNESKSINRDSKTTTNLPVQIGDKAWTRDILQSLQNDTDDDVRIAVAKALRPMNKPGQLEFANGEKVIFQGLVNFSNLNNKIGKIIRYDETKERYEVEYTDQKKRNTVTVLKQNLKPGSVSVKIQNNTDEDISHFLKTMGIKQPYTSNLSSELVSYRETQTPEFMDIAKMVFKNHLPSVRRTSLLQPQAYLLNPPITTHPPVQIRQMNNPGQYHKRFGREQVGVFALGSISRGTCFSFTGKRTVAEQTTLHLFPLTKEQIEFCANLEINPSNNPASNALMIGPFDCSFFTDPTKLCNFTTFINYNRKLEEANCHIQCAIINDDLHNVVLVTKEILPGEELLADYGG